MTHAELLFAKTANRITKLVGTRGLTCGQIERLASRLFGRKWIGCFPQDHVPLKKKGFSIVNVDKAGKKGSHWVAVYNTGKTLYIYDSFGRPSTTLLKHLSSVARQRYNLKLVDSRLDAEQFGKKSQICGQLSLAWLVAVQTLGIRQAITI